MVSRLGLHHGLGQRGQRHLAHRGGGERAVMAPRRARKLRLSVIVVFIASVAQWPAPSAAGCAGDTGVAPRHRLADEAPCSAASASQKSRCASIAGIDAGDLVARVGQQLEHADQHAVVAKQVFVGDASCAAARSRRGSGGRGRRRCGRRRSSRAPASWRRPRSARRGSAPAM